MNAIAFYGRAGSSWQGSFLPWALANGPVLQAGGFERLLWHNPGGVYALPERGDPHERVMWPDQWSIAEAQGRPFANRDELAAAHTILHRMYGVTETIYYIGEPIILADPLEDGLRCCEPFLLPGASLAFDHSAKPPDDPQDRWRWERFRQLILELRSRGHGVYLEARCDPAKPDMAGLIIGTIALARYDANRSIDPQEHAQFGEVIRITGSAAEERDGQVNQWPAGVTPALRNWGRIRTE